MADAASLHLEMLDAAKRRDIERIRELYHPDYTYRSGDGVEQEGADAGIAVVELYTSAFPDLAFRVDHQWTPSATVSIIEMTATGTHTGDLGELPATFKKVEVVVCNVIETKDGKIIAEREYYDGMSMMQQLGVMEG